MAKATKPNPPEVLDVLRRSCAVEGFRLDRLWSAILEEMLTLYYPPFRAEDDIELLDQTGVGLKAYVQDLIEFDEETLKRAWRETRRAHKVERWPTIEAIRRNCLDTAPVRHEGPSASVSELFKRYDSKDVARMVGFREGRVWMKEFFGPYPGDEHCEIPDGLLRAFGVKPFERKVENVGETVD